MKAKIISLAISALCVTGIAYASHHHSKVAIAVNLPGTTTVVAANPPLAYPPPPPPPAPYYGHHHHHHSGFGWLAMTTGAPLPEGLVIGGSQRNPPATLFVCRAHFRGGMHPGKLIDGYCNIGWGGSEISMTNYEVLISHAPLNWVAGGNGYMPVNAVQGGYQQDGPLYICQAHYRGGMHPGKIVGGMCNIGWGGREVSIPYYNVLVR